MRTPSTLGKALDNVFTLIIFFILLFACNLATFPWLTLATAQNVVWDAASAADAGRPPDAAFVRGGASGARARGADIWRKRNTENMATQKKNTCEKVNTRSQNGLCVTWYTDLGCERNCGIGQGPHFQCVSSSPWKYDRI